MSKYRRTVIIGFKPLPEDIEELLLQGFLYVDHVNEEEFMKHYRWYIDQWKLHGIQCVIVDSHVDIPEDILEKLKKQFKVYRERAMHPLKLYIEV